MVGGDIYKYITVLSPIEGHLFGTMYFQIKGTM